MTQLHGEEEPIAIIGTACRLPGDVSNLDGLWDMISRAKTGHGRIPKDRWDADAWYHPDPDRKGGISVNHGYFLQQDVGHFDAPFFSTTAKEAAAMDPMKRLLLEVSYESIENAGIPLERLMNSRTGCYVGCMTNDYEMLSLRDIYDIGHNAASATSEAMTANRVSWFFGLRGPSLTLDTACSSSLYTLHLACQSLRLGETDMSLVAGVNLMLNPNTMHQLSAMHMLSPEGISHTFDDRANGYGRGEGIACLVVKRLSDALRDGDTIRAVVRATGINADGKTPSITQPSSDAQIELIRSTYKAAGLDMKDTAYFECHGTGTPVGDPIELTAIAATLGARRRELGMPPLYIGSVKPNVGHTEGCSGLAGVLKAVACLEKGMLVPTYGVETVNPKLKLAEWNLALPGGTMKWPSRGQRRISVNSFGFGGANAHAVLDDAYHYLSDRGIIGNHNTSLDDDDSESGIGSSPSSGAGTPCTSRSESDSLSRRRLFVFSSKDQGGLKRLTQSYKTALSSSKYKWDDQVSSLTENELDNLAYTLAERRTHFDFRGFIVASSLSELSAGLDQGIVRYKRSARGGQHANLLFVFTGQGAQWPAMGVQLLKNHIFRQSVLRSQKHLYDLGCSWDVVEELSKLDGSRISQPEYSQTLCTVLQVALTDLLRHWNVGPTATVGHSSGEIAAAYAAGYLTQADAAKIAYIRGLSSAAVTIPGSMLAAGLSRVEAQVYLDKVSSLGLGVACVACVNSPSSVTLSGDTEAISELERMISDDGKFARKLKVTTAYHSPHMKAVADGYLEKMGNIAVCNPDHQQTFMYSSLTGQLVEPSQLSAEYWVSNMCAPVEFSAAVTGLLAHRRRSADDDSHAVPLQWDGIVELGPHAALKGPVQQIIAAANNKSAKEAPYVAMVLRGEDAAQTSTSVAGRLWAAGHPVNLASVNTQSEQVDVLSSSVTLPHKPRLRALSNLPTYPWNHIRRFWHEAFSTEANRWPTHARTDLLGVPVDQQNSFEPRWRNYLRISENPWIEDHRITGVTLYPAAGMLVMALEGAAKLAEVSQGPLRGFQFTDVAFERGLVVSAEDDDDDRVVETQLSLLPDEHHPDQYHFTIFSTQTASSWTRHCHGTITLKYEPSGPSSVEEIQEPDPEWVQQTQWFQKLKQEDSDIEDVDTDEFYDHLDSIGMNYGPLFRNVTSLTAVPARQSSYGTIIIPDTQASMPENHEFPHIIHPATMDSIFHIVLASLNDGKAVTEAAVPYSIKHMFVSANQPKGAGSEFLGYGQLTSKSHDGHEITGDLIISDSDWTGPKLTVKGFALRQVTASSSSATATGSRSDASSLKKCARIEWTEHKELIKGLATTEVATSPDGVALPEEVYLILPSEDDAAFEATACLATALEGLLGKFNISVHRSPLIATAREDLLNKHVISLLETEKPCIYSWTEEEFYSFKAIISRVAHLFWVTRGGLLEAWTGGADFAPAQGLLRVLRNEYTSSSLPHLDLSPEFDPALSSNAHLILDVWIDSLKSNSEQEYAEANGTIHVPRVDDEPGFDAELQAASGQRLPEPTRLGNMEGSHNLVLTTDGAHTMAVPADLVAAEPLGAYEVEVQVEFAGMCATFEAVANQAPSSVSRAKALVGTVTSCGSEVKSTSIGQLVSVLQPQSIPGIPTRLRAQEGWVAGVPPFIAPEDATTMSLAFLAAQRTLLDLACLHTGQAVLINSAATEVGQAAVQIAQMAGAIVFALVESREEKDLLINQYSIPTDHIFDSNLGRFVSAIQHICGPQGAHVVLNILDNKATPALAAVLGEDAYFFDISPSPSSSASASRSSTVVLPPNSSFVRINMSKFIDTRAEIAQALHQRTFRDLARRRVIQPIQPSAVYSVEDLSLAMKALSDGISTQEKICLAIHEDATVFAVPPPPSELALPADATYVLAGGLGALGLKIAHMMVDHGARDLVFISRSGGGKNAAELDAFRARGVSADAFKCDVTDAHGVATVFQQLKNQGRIVKGVVQCAMVLEDTIFENMTHAKWQRAFLPKTRGSRNLLANLWPGDDPFFILLSSITGVIGNTAQSNYASGNTFEDALAHHARAHLGIKATSIDVGLVSDSSHFTSAGEFGDLENYLHKYQHGWAGLQTSLDELKVALKAILRGSTVDGSTIPAQFVLGLGSDLRRTDDSTGFQRDHKFDRRVLAVGGDNKPSASAKEANIGKRLQEAKSYGEAAEAVELFLKKQISQSSGIDLEEVDAQKPLPEFGVDSLNAVEIRNRVLKEMLSEVSVFELLSNTSMASLAVKIASRSRLVHVEGSEDQ